MAGCLQFINHEEGRIIPAGNEYQYHIKDHLGNVRVTFTTKAETEVATAGYEPANAALEQSKFLRYEHSRKVQSSVFDRTNGTATGYAQRLSGGTNERYGLSRSLSVMPGDKISAEVYAKYVDPVSTNRTPALNSLISQIATLISGGTTGSGTVIDGGSFPVSTASFPFPTQAGTNTTGSSGTGPRAYLNWLVFDRDYNWISSKSGYKRLSATPKETGQGVGLDVNHEALNSPEITIDVAGYVYIFLSNEEATPVDVYFDDFKVTQVKSPVIAMDDYYPFGMMFNSFERESMLENRKKFQGQEHVKDLGLNWDSFKWRNHQPDVGRFFGIDPLSEKYLYNSPYAFSENKVIAHVELEGLESAPNPLGVDPMDLAPDPEPSAANGAEEQDNSIISSIFSEIAGVWHSANDWVKDRMAGPKDGYTVTIVGESSGPDAGKGPKAKDPSKHNMVDKNLIDALNASNKNTTAPGSRASREQIDKGGQPKSKEKTEKAIFTATKATGKGAVAAQQIKEKEKTSSTVPDYVTQDSILSISGYDSTWLKNK